VEITYGLERIAMTLQGVGDFRDIRWNEAITDGALNFQGEQEHSQYYFEIAEVERLRQRYAAKFATLARQIMTAQQRLDREQEQYKEQMTHTAISMGATILGSILGRKASQIGRATTSARSASRAYYEKMDIERARQQVEMARSRQAEMDKQVEEEASRIALSLDPNAEVLQPIVLRPKKKDIMVQWSGLLWLPYWHLDSGAVEAGFRLA